MGKRELIALLNLSSWCLVMVERIFLAVPRGCLQFVIVVFPDHTHLLFLTDWNYCRFRYLANALHNQQFLIRGIVCPFRAVLNILCFSLLAVNREKPGLNFLSSSVQSKLVGLSLRH